LRASTSAGGVLYAAASRNTSLRESPDVREEAK